MTSTVEPLNGTLFTDNPCFGCGPVHPFGFHLRFEREPGAGILGHFTPTAQHQGPPGIMHGGLVSTLADETAAWAVIADSGRFGFTTSFDCRLHRPTRINVATELRAAVTRSTSRVVRVAVRISQLGLDCFTGDFNFLVLDASSAEKLLGGPLPEDMRRFCR